ncbi:MAG: putative peptidoglycan glycosyltransferase FtsW, partial [Patescibacteria group bacterium]
MKKSFNYFLFFLVVFLNVFGLLFLTTLSAPSSLKQFGTTNYYLFHQLLYGLLPALFFGFVAFKTPLRLIKKIAPWLLFLNLIALALVFFPFLGFRFWGAKRWLNLGFTTIQPSEFLKITAVLYLSAWLSSRISDHAHKGWISMAKKGYYNLIHIFAPFLIFLGVIATILILQPDISTLGVIGLTLVAVYFSAKTPLWHTFSTIAAGFGALMLLIKFEPYRFDRLFMFLHPESDPLGKGLQIKQSIIALGSGGFFGKGLGMSNQKFGRLPQAMSDSVYAVIGEELGIIGCVGLIILFILLFWLGFKIAKSSNDRFSKLTAVGITVWITLQAFINMASAAGIFPLAGIPLPFFSYGGSHLITEIIGIGILLNISKN